MADLLSSHWEPCSSCSCSNHRLPSYHFPTENISPPYLERLALCNDPPSPTETDELKLAVLSYEQQIQNLTADEEKLQKMLAKMQDSVEEKAGILLREKERALAAINRRKHVLSPVRRLPVEILFYIFLRTIEFPIRRTQDLYTDLEHPPDNPMFSIACVSKQWKMVAMSSPKLWSYVNIVLTDENFEDQSYARRLGEQCSYSRNHPLFVCIADDSVNNFPDQLAGILFTISRDIQELHLFLRSSTFIEFDQLRLSLPSLERLSLVALDTDLFDDEEKLQFFPTSSKLRTLEIVDINEPSGYFVVPWNQINTYKSSHSHMDSDFNWGPTSYQHLKVLRELTQLEKCTLRCEDNIAEVEFGDEVFPLTCANLRSMKISSSARVSESSSDTALKQILVRLILPALTSLKVDCLSCEGTGTFTAVRELIIKSHCPITVLHFDHGFILEEDFLHILRQTPTLEDVRLTHVDVSFDKTFTELTPKLDGATILVPHLQTLHLGGNVVSDMEVFVNMVAARWNIAPLHVPSGQRLMEVSLCRLLPTDEPSDEVNMATALSTLDVYMTQGLRFTFSTEYMLNVGEQ
ncbi:uncharacterized protein EV420DRAFT_1182020 [Desarmillaria tabescens]|uniref:F-box domain-containing protein n=1 Tax=Armillaria tabescens TaxID=1929756 RepID=A0AA39NB16_ARMTA|nr:uncharacterized protein EV420DRAFT_1182020 [Desarmillaria tabescens]KAK0462340.1 hypothetical protein EV420DRAFT_1182020 [Desarmillaria tabescens]